MFFYCKKRREEYLLTERQKRFCDEYILDLNATKACVRAGYSEKTATEQASRLLTNVKVSEYISKKISEIQSNNIADATEVLEYLTETMRNEEVQQKDRLKSAELLGKRHGLFKENVSITGAIPIVIVDDLDNE